MMLGRKDFQERDRLRRGAGVGPGRGLDRSGLEKLRAWQCRVLEGKGRVSSFLPEVKLPSWWQTGPRLLTTSGGEGAGLRSAGLPVNSPAQQETSSASAAG